MLDFHCLISLLGTSAWKHPSSLPLSFYGSKMNCVNCAHLDLQCSQGAVSMLTHWLRHVYLGFPVCFHPIDYLSTVSATFKALALLLARYLLDFSQLSGSSLDLSKDFWILRGSKRKPVPTPSVSMKRRTLTVVCRNHHYLNLA